MLILNPRTWETETVRLCEFKAGLVYRVSSWATQWDSASNKKIASHEYIEQTF